MRWILYTLLVFNLIYFAWWIFYEEPVNLTVESASTLVDPRHEIRLLKEVSASSLVELQEVVNKPSVRIDPSPGKDKCQAIGPFLSVFEGQDVVNQLQALGLSLTARAVDRPSGKFDYRLLIPPMNSLEEAFRKLRELQASEIDSYVITAGPSALGISMGVFSTEAAAERVRENVKAEGFEGQIVTISRTNRTYWLFAEAGERLDISEIVWEKLKREGNLLEKKDFSCE